MSGEGRRYRILETLGKGGFGVVYRAELMAAGGFTKQVALKVLNAEPEEGDDFAQRLRDEARILGLIKHRAIVGVDALAELAGNWAVIMEYVDGVDVKAFVDTAALHPKMALEIVEDVASALHTAFFTLSPTTGAPLQLMHRDIKPANIRVTPQGEVKLLDFGIARAEFAERESETTDRLYGSIKYMAPERLEAIESPNADVWSLGIVFVELVAGTNLKAPPKHPRRFHEWMEGATAQMRKRMSEFEPKVPEPQQQAMVELAAALMAFEPHDRIDAKEVERRCRELKPQLPGPWLREWAEDEVPRLQVLGSSESVDDTMSGQILSEATTLRSEKTAEQTADLPQTTPYGLIGMFAAVGFVGVMALGVGVMYGTGVGLTDDRADVEVAPVIDPEPAPEPPAQPEPEPAPTPEPVAEGSDAEDEPPPPPVLVPVDDAPPIKPAPQIVVVGPDDSKPPDDGGKTFGLMGLPDDMHHDGTAEAAVIGGTVTVQGDVKQVWLVSEKGEYPAGIVPPGTYAIKAWFDDGDPVTAGVVEVQKGVSTNVRCFGVTKQCSVGP